MTYPDRAAPDLDGDVRQLLDRWAAQKSVGTNDLDVATVRRDDQAVLALQRRVGELHAVSDIDVDGVPVRVYRPQPGWLPSLLFFHGGGWTVGRDGYDSPLRELALASGYLIVSPQCRLAPEHPFPAALEDALTVGRWLASGAHRLGTSAAAPAVAGDSSGGNLAATVSLSLASEDATPAFQLLIYPMLDAAAGSGSYTDYASGFGFSGAKSRWYFDQYLSDRQDRRDPRVSPLFAQGLRLLPQTLIVTAECDPVRDDGERYAARLRRAGVDVELRRYPGTIHGFFQMTGALESARTLHRDLGLWLRRTSLAAEGKSR